jgi:subtilisin family serine protease
MSGILLCLLCLAHSAYAAEISDPLSSENAYLQDNSFKLPITGKSAISAVDKSNLTTVQRRLSSDLVDLVERQKGDAGIQDQKLFYRAATDNLLLNSNSKMDSRDSAGHDETDLIYVYIYLTPTASTAVIDPYVAEVTARDERHHRAVAWVRPRDLEALASLDAVKAVQTVLPPLTDQPPNTLPLSGKGSAITEGIELHNINQLIAILNRYGEGIKIGVVSDGVDNISESVESGDLPSDVTVLKNNRGWKAPPENEGTAMLEIIHDIAPNAALYFHEMGPDQYSFLQAVRALADAGCMVICEDVSCSDFPSFEDGDVVSDFAELIDNESIIYVTSAGNDAVGHYQGTFYPDVRHNASYYHDFSGGNRETPDLYIIFEPAKISGDFIYPSMALVTLQWDDKWGESANDYDLELLEVLEMNQNGVRYGGPLLQSDGDQHETGIPFESMVISYTGDETLITAVTVKNYMGQAEPRNLEIFVKPLQLCEVSSTNMVPGDSIFGQAALPGAITVGAVDAAIPGNTRIENFSSQGPVTIAHPAKAMRMKPDLVAADNVSVSGAGGFGVLFNGTSASAPHIAGIVGVLWSKNLDENATQIKERLYASTKDLGGQGIDPVYGRGLPALWGHSTQTPTTNVTPAPPANVIPGATSTTMPEATENVSNDGSG